MAQPDQSSIDRRLTDLKDAVGLTWDQLADRAGISSSGLRRIRQGEVVPRAITRQGLAYALHVDQGEIDQLLGVDPGTVESDELTFEDFGLIQARNLFQHRLMTGSGKPMISALLVDVAPRLLSELTDEEIVAVQTKLADYAVFVVNQTIQERTKES